MGGVLSGLLILVGLPAGLIYLSRRHSQRQRAKAERLQADVERFGSFMLTLFGRHSKQQQRPPMGIPVQTPPMGIPVV